MSTFGCAMSIFARSTMAPSGNSPAFMRRRRSRLSAAGRLAERAVRAGPVEGPALLADGLLRLGVDVGVPLAHEPLGALVHPREEVRRVVERVAPLAAEPADVRLDRLDVLGLLGDGVRVVEAQVRPAAEGAGEAEVEEDRLRVADVEKPVRLRREAGHDLAAVLAGGEIGRDDVGEEIARRVGHLGRCWYPSGGGAATSRTFGGGAGEGAASGVRSGAPSTVECRPTGILERWGAEPSCTPAGTSRPPRPRDALRAAGRCRAAAILSTVVRR